MGGKIAAITVAKNGDIWLGTHYENQVYRYDGTLWRKYTAIDGLVSGDIYTIAMDKDDNKWIALWDKGFTGGVSKFDGSKWKSFSTQDGMSSNQNTCLVIDKEDKKWFGSQNGISKMVGEDWTTYTTLNTNGALVGNFITSIAIDKEGNKWFGTQSGISKLSDVVLGISNFDTSPRASLSPNPFTDQTIIIFPTVGNYKVTIMDMQGKVVKELDQQQTQQIILDLSEQMTGMYLYNASENQSNKRYNGKLLINR